MPRLIDLARRTAFGTLRLAFRLLPLDEATRDRLRLAFTDRAGWLVPHAPRGRIGVAMLGRRARAQAGGRAVGFVEAGDAVLPDPLPARLIAFYLPQFHPIPENDAWWGTGFTEWHNVTRALPQFEGHAQPRLPADLGFYDLRETHTLRAQAALAAAHGIEGFCVYFYWFGGRTLLEAPLASWLADPSIAMPLCLCWANESWTRNWDGRPGETLIAQTEGDTGADDATAFIAHVARYLRDPRYIRVDGRPLLLVYRAELLRDASATAARWRAWCRDGGIGEIVIACVQGFARRDPREFGFDIAVEFPPNMAPPTDVTARQYLLNPDYRGHVLDWRALADEHARRALPDYPCFPGVNAGWDNAPRRPGAGRTYLHASPRGYRDWLRRTIAHRLAGRPASERVVFINAWNEWAEGAVLEPDMRLGHAWLRATSDALRGAADDIVKGDSARGAGQAVTSPVARPCVVIHAWYVDVFADLLTTLQASRVDWRIVVTTTENRRDAITAILAARGMAAELVADDNRGRDVLPFLRAANRLLDDGETLVLKLHTKRSPHRGDGDLWRTEMVDALASADAVARALDAFAGSPDLGLLVPSGHLQPMSYFWGDNEDNVRYLATRLGLDPPVDADARFAAGSMFWARLDALRPVLDAHLDEWEFEPEAAQVDGTMAHAVERIVALAATHAGYAVRETGSANGGEYRFARRG